MHRAHRFGLLAVLLALAACAAPQRVGQSAMVRFGVVRSAEPVPLDSNATAGALIGGTIGLASAQGSSNRRAARNTILGLGVGGAVGAAAANQTLRGVSYTVDMADGSTVRIVSDQREIRPGDCVAVEQVRDTANIRRASEDFCDAQNARAVQAVQASLMDEAAKCAAAKNELVQASTTDEADLAAQKIELLCNT